MMIVVRTSVVVDLIGDLDATLISAFSEALTELADGGTTDILLSTRGLSPASGGAMAALNAAVSGARRRGCSIAIHPGNRKMRAAFASTRIERDAYAGQRRAPARHLIIARHVPAI